MNKLTILRDAEETIDNILKLETLDKNEKESISEMFERLKHPSVQVYYDHIPARSLVNYDYIKTTQMVFLAYLLAAHYAEITTIEQLPILKHSVEGLSFKVNEENLAFKNMIAKAYLLSFAAYNDKEYSKLRHMNLKAIAAACLIVGLGIFAATAAVLTELLLFAAFPAMPLLTVAGVTFGCVMLATIPLISSYAAALCLYETFKYKPQTHTFKIDENNVTVSTYPNAFFAKTPRNYLDDARMLINEIEPTLSNQVEFY